MKTSALHSPEDLAPFLRALGQEKKKIGYDPGGSPVWFYHALKEAGAEIVLMDDPCALPKARKNATEIEGMRRAHLLDGAALTRFLRWFDALPHDAHVTETDIAAKLEAFRKENPDYLGPSFATIAGSGPNGAIVHYRAEAASARAVETGDVLLLDSGGQYPFGTTDVTRVVARGAPPPGFKERFTRVLKGHIALARAVFPEGTAGGQLDALARQYLWAAGLDYDHGTGHGVGAYLCVHEGPQRIGKKGGGAALEPGMILSNEPGYYEENAYGVRIESLVLVVRRPEIGAESLGFETLTLAPLDARLIEDAMLTAEERAWLDAYHARVLRELAPLLTEEERAWLAAQRSAHYL